MKTPKLVNAESADLVLSRELFAARPNNEARDALVSMYLPLAEYLARRFVRRGEEFDDLVQVATIGLIKAIDRFDPGRAFQFSTYATPTIVGELKRHFRDKCWMLHVPRRLQELGLRVSAIQADLHQELGRSPTVKEIASHAGLSEDDVIEAVAAMRACSVGSLDALDLEGGTVDFGGEDERLETLERWLTIAPALRLLPERDRTLLSKRYFGFMSQSEIAAELGVSQMHVSRLLGRLLAALAASVRQ